MTNILPQFSNFLLKGKFYHLNYAVLLSQWFSVFFCFSFVCVCVCFVIFFKHKDTQVSNSEVSV